MMVNQILSKVFRVIKSPFQRWSTYVKQKLRWNGIVRFNRTVHISETSSFEGANSIGDRSAFQGSMGFGSYIGGDSWVEAKIGRFCSIGYGLRTIRGIHPLHEPFVTTSPVFYSMRKQAMVSFAEKQFFDELLPPVSIGNDCWIGERVSIVGGHSIGDGAVVLTGAVVTGDVPPFAIVGGVPARIIRYRYDETTIAWLLKVSWWNRPIEWLKEHSEALSNMELLNDLLEGKQ